MTELKINELSKLFGTSEKDLYKFCSNRALKEFNGHYKRLDELNRNEALLRAVKKIYAFDDKRSGWDRLPEWETGWTENLEDLIEKSEKKTALVPRYVKPNQIVRLFDDYVLFEDPNFIRTYIELFRSWLCNKYFSNSTNIYEFGCGSCSHVAYLAENFPDKNIHGLDWAEASVKICNILNSDHKLRVSGHLFNFFEPDLGLKIENNSSVFTFGALEQCGNKFHSFIDYLIAMSPDVCIHVEGLDELYDQSQLFDFLAYEYNKKRNYLTGLLDYLKILEAGSKIEILKVHRHKLGTEYNDTFSYVIWKPITRGEK